MYILSIEEKCVLMFALGAGAATDPLVKVGEENPFFALGQKMAGADIYIETVNEKGGE